MEDSLTSPAHVPAPSSISYLPSSILIRGVNWLGDAVMTTPALQRLRERFPGAHITLLTHEKLVDLWLHHPSIDEVMSFGAAESVWSVASRLRFSQSQGTFTEALLYNGSGDARSPFGAMTEALEGISAWLRQVIPPRFDLALVLPNSPRSALEVWLARIPHRLGCAQPWRKPFLTHAVPARPGRVRMHKRSAAEIERLIHARERNTEPTPRATFPSTAHQIHEYLHLTTALGANPEPLAPKLEVTATELEQAKEKFLSGLLENPSDTRSGQRPIVLGLNPGAEYGPAKRWPAENFAAAAREVSRRMNGCVWLAFGGPNDAKLCHAIAQLAGGSVVNLAGKTSLRELMALLKLCRVLLTNDTGPMHVAAALGTPVVVPFGSTSPEMTGPGLPGDTRHRFLFSNVACAPCFRRTCPIDFRCMTSLGVKRVIDAVLQMAAASS
jgi:heptosyltransferase-2